MGWISDLDKVLVHKATVFRCKGGGWARIAAGMVAGGKEGVNGTAADGYFERYMLLFIFFPRFGLSHPPTFSEFLPDVGATLSSARGVETSRGI
jgi:hypothetical protein